MEEITFQVQRDEASGRLVAWWDDPSGLGGITTQGEDLGDLQRQIIDGRGSFRGCRGSAPNSRAFRQRSYPGSSVKLPRDVSGAEAVKASYPAGFVVTRQSGSHARVIGGNRPITVPMHRALAVGTLQSILRQADLSVEGFLSARN